MLETVISTPTTTKDLLQPPGSSFREWKLGGVECFDATALHSKRIVHIQLTGTASFHVDLVVAPGLTLLASGSSVAHIKTLQLTSKLPTTNEPANSDSGSNNNNSNDTTKNILRASGISSITVDTLILPTDTHMTCESHLKGTVCVHNEIRKPPLCAVPCQVPALLSAEPDTPVPSTLPPRKRHRSFSQTATAIPTTTIPASRAAATTHTSLPPKKRRRTLVGISPLDSTKLADD